MVYSGVAGAAGTKQPAAPAVKSKRFTHEIPDTPFKYCDQCKDPARSAASNVAEGFGRFKHKEFAQFLDYSVGSLQELHDLLIDGHSRGYVTQDELSAGIQLSKRAKAACVSLAGYLRRTPDPPRN